MAMLRVLTLSTLFPNAARPVFGLFVERQVRSLAALPDVQVEVVAPIGLPVWPISRHPHYAPLARLPEGEEWNGIPVRRPCFRVWPKIGEAGAARNLADSVLPLLKSIRENFPFDVINAEFFWPDGPAAMHLSDALDVPFSVKARGADIHYWGKRPGIGSQILAASRAASGLLAVSDAMRQDMIALGMPGDKIRVHYTGVDLNLFCPRGRGEVRATFGLAGPILVTIGALIPRKNQSLTIKSLSHLPDATLLVVGDGPDRKTLRSFARDVGVEARVHFLGNRPPTEVARLLAAADVMVLPSKAEGLANVWVEALAAGTPIVISDVGGARELLDSESVGRIVKQDPAQIAAAVRELLTSPPEAEALRKVAERFTWERNAAGLRDHLLKIAFSRSA